MWPRNAELCAELRDRIQFEHRSLAPALEGEGGLHLEVVRGGALSSSGDPLALTLYYLGDGFLLRHSVTDWIVMPLHLNCGILWCRNPKVLGRGFWNF